MKTLQKVGGIAALICAGTYILAMGLVATLLTPMLDSALPYDQFIAFYLPHQSLVFVWHFSMYLVNGTCLALLASGAVPTATSPAHRLWHSWPPVSACSGRGWSLPAASSPSTAGKPSAGSHPLTHPRPLHSGWWCTPLPPASTPPTASWGVCGCCSPVGPPCAPANCPGR